MNNVLFIGGPKDGVIEVVPELNPFIRVYSNGTPKSELILEDDQLLKKSYIEQTEFVYHLDRIFYNQEEPGDKSFDLYVVDSLTFEEAMEKIFNIYSGFCLLKDK